jgi:hypothetical protein
MGIGERVMEEVCAVISSLPKLETLNLRGNRALGLEKLLECLKQKGKILKKLDIRGNETAKDENVVKELKKVCEVVFL